MLVDQGAAQVCPGRVHYCRITSPISGRVGVRLIDPRQHHRASGFDTSRRAPPRPRPASSASTRSPPIAVTFTVPQGDFQQLSDASHGFSQMLSAQALSQETGAVLGTGELVVADNHVDANTGTVQPGRPASPTKGGR